MENIKSMKKDELINLLNIKFKEIEELNKTIVTLKAENAALNDCLATTKARTKTTNEIIYVKACREKDYVAVSVSVPKYLPFSQSASYGIKQGLKTFGAKFNGKKIGSTWLPIDSSKPMTWIMGLKNFDDWKASQTPDQLNHLQMVMEVSEVA